MKVRFSWVFLAVGAAVVVTWARHLAARRAWREDAQAEVDLYRLRGGRAR